VIYIDDHIWDFDLQEALAAVSPQRRAYALRYRQERDQRLCVAAYRLLQRALSLEYHINEPPLFLCEGNGKPLLQDHPDIHFGLSHCHKAVACAVSSQPIGIDVETFDHYSPELAVQVMNQNELCQIQASANPAIAFTRLWTMKESYYKLTGDTALSSIPHMLSRAGDCHFDITIHPCYVLTCCTQSHNRHVAQP